MENAVEAFKMAFAIFVFVIALALALSVIGQVRVTSDVILSLNDKTNDYEYVNNESDINALGKDRIVGFETILPSIYRYAQEQYAVTIVTNRGQAIARYDLYTEGFMTNWDYILGHQNQEDEKQYLQEIQDRIAIVDEVIYKETGYSNVIWSNLYSPNNDQHLYKVTNANNTSIKVGAPWGNVSTEIIKRINADFGVESSNNNEYTKNGIKYKGKNLNQYKDSKFKEKFIEIQTSGTTITEMDTDNNIEYSLETVKGNKKLEIIYIIQPD